MATAKVKMLTTRTLTKITTRGRPFVIRSTFSPR
jgi:hypothetical protein